jgi:hypothetical protein
MRLAKYTSIILSITLAGCQGEVPEARQEAVRAKTDGKVKRLEKDAEEIARQSEAAVSELERNADAYNDSGSTDYTTSNDRYVREGRNDRSEDFGYVEGDNGPASEQGNSQDEF